MATGHHHQRSFQQDSHSNSPELGRHSGGHPSGLGGGRFHPYSRHQQIVPQTAVPTSGYTNPTPPAAWLNASDTTGQSMYQDSRSPSYSGRHGGASSSPSVAQHDLPNFQSPASHEGTVGSQIPGPSRNYEQSSRTAMPAAQPLQQSAQRSSSIWHRGPSESGTAQRFTALSTPSPHAVNESYQNPYLPSQSEAHPMGQRIPARDSARGSRRLAALAMDDEVKDGESSAGEEYNEESEEQALSKTKGVEKTEKTSTAKENVRRGLTRTNADGELEWVATTHSDGVLAVRHHDIRSRLIAKAEAERVALGVQIEHPDEPGPGTDNVTSFYRKHVTWGPDRENRPEILFTWKEDWEKNPRPEFPGYMNWEENGKEYLVLDPHDNPIKDWDIPATIASNVPGYKLEAMRRENMSLVHKDLWSRMPSRINVGTEHFPKWEELRIPNSTVNMPMERFRFIAGLSSWTERRKTLVIKKGLQKLYGNFLQNNSVKAFGRDLTTIEIREIKKGEKAVFPILSDSVHWTQRAQKHRSNVAAKPTRPKGNTKVEKALLKKRKRAADDERQASEEEALSQLRSRKRGRHGSEESSIAAEVDDLVMFDNHPSTIDQVDSLRRYPLRSTRESAKAPETVQSGDELSDESSADEEYEDVPTQRYSPRRTRRPATTKHSGRVEESSEEDSAETDEEEMPAHRSAFSRNPRAEEVGSKSKGLSCISSTDDPSQGNEEKEDRRTAVLGNIGQSAQDSTYEGLSSNEPAHDAGVSDAPIQSESQTPEINGASLEQNRSPLSQSHACEAMMNEPLFERRYPEGELTALQAHRKWVKDFHEDKDGLKRLRTGQPVLPLPAAATHRRVSDIPPQIISRSRTSPQIIPQQVDHPSRAPPGPQAPSSEIREQQLDTESAQVPELPIMAPGSEPVNYNKIPPSNNEEVQSLIDALLPTREVYSVWTGQPAPRTDPQQSYRAQFVMILGAFQDWWGAHRSREPLPILIGVMHLGRSVDDWEPPVKDSIYYEAFRMGDRAPRGVDGQIMDFLEWPGERLEHVLRKM